MGRGAATAGLVQELRWLDPVGASATCGEATTAGKNQRRYREGEKEIEGEEKARGEGHGLLVMLDGDEVRYGDAGVERSARAEEEHRVAAGMDPKEEDRGGDGAEENEGGTRG